MLYTVDVDSSAMYDFEMRYAESGSSGKFHLELDGTEVTPVTTTLTTGGWTTWKTLTINQVILQKGKRQIKFFVDKAGFNINSMKFSNPQELVNIDPKILNIKTDQTGKFLHLISNLSYGLNSLPQKNDFEVTINGVITTIDSIYFSTSSTFDLVFNIGQQLKSIDVIQVSYSGNSLKSETGLQFPTFSKIRAINTSPMYYQLPGTVQAENYVVNHGLSAETCTDSGGGQDMGYTDAGDYLDYLVYVPYNGTFLFEYRIASTMGGSIELRIVDNPANPVTIHSVTILNTGGWQNWQIVSATGKLTQGTHTLRVYVKQAQFNINWFKVTLVTGIFSIDDLKRIQVFPNPVSDQIYFIAEGLAGKYDVKITNLQGKVVMQFPLDMSSGKLEQTDLSALPDGFYIFSIDYKSGIYQQKIIKMRKD